ncbi:hypothetical protein EMEDMD4_170032 [Sinorhizobium medicae]|uniref:Uncharacterized protein n=1 Tax=Sinorhizobium medicae TaxID=110321 RepID=A0A508WUR6_9HYPH|nr:hypothetical protein EMEDMD4_170032 [Sinorhizobium medicae]
MRSISLASLIGIERAVLDLLGNIPEDVCCAVPAFDFDELREGVGGKPLDDHLDGRTHLIEHCLGASLDQAVAQDVLHCFSGGSWGFHGFTSCNRASLGVEGL